MEEYTQRLTESSWNNKEWICSICGRQNKEEFKKHMKDAIDIRVQSYYRNRFVKNK